MNKKPKTKQSIDSRLIINVLLLALTFFVLLNFYFVYQVKHNPRVTGGAAAPVPNIEMLVITAPECPQCSNIDSFISTVRERRLNLTSERSIPWTDPEARSLIDKYEITRVPTIVLKGDIDIIHIEPFRRYDDVLVIKAVPPPFFDMGSGRVRGEVVMTLITAHGCTKCFDVSIAADQLMEVIVVKESRVMMHTDDAAQQIIEKYNITTVPSLVLSGDAGLYNNLNRSWDAVGTREQDSSLVLRQMPPPFLDLSSGTIKGIVALTYLTDANCAECYNVTVHKDVLQGLGLAIENETYVDYSSQEGKSLALKYNLSGVPTVIISKEAGLYPVFTQIWQQVGTKGNDGSFVFRGFETLGKVRWLDIPTGRIRGVPTYIVNLTSNQTTVSDEAALSES